VYSLFSETQGRVVLTCAESDAEALTELLVSHDVPWSVIGEVGGDVLVIEGKVDLPLARITEAFETTLERLVGGDAPLGEELHEG
jgi:phosphoribosylformylglycinamidine synthase